MLMQIRFVCLVVLLLSQSPNTAAYAARTALLPPYEVSFVARLSANTSLKDDDLVGFRVSYNITLLNLSSITQTGQQHLVPASSLENFAYARSGSGGSTLRAMDYYVDLCGNGGSASNLFVPGNTGSNTPFPSTLRYVTFSIAPGSSAMLKSSVYFIGQYGPISKPNRFKDVATLVKSIFKMLINEDRGAVNGSVAVDVSGIVGGATSSTYCGGHTITGPRYSGGLPESNVSPPLLINGGRPF